MEHLNNTVDSDQVSKVETFFSHVVVADDE